MLNETRLVDFMLDLCATDSESKEEYPVAIKLQAAMQSLGAEVFMDGAGEAVGGNSGNLICRLPGNTDAAPAIFLSAHMDTVKPGKGVKPVRQDNIIRTDGTTVLGGDDKSGCAIIVEVCRVLQERNLPHGDIEIIFTICEENGLLGAKFADISQLKSLYGLVLDSDDPGFLFTRAAGNIRQKWTVSGLEAHAGMFPEKGINAIRIASEAIAAMTLGKIDHETTANIGTIEGGAGINVVPAKVVVQGEARSMNPAKLEKQMRQMDDCFREAVARYKATVDGVEYAASLEIETIGDYKPMILDDNDPLVSLVKQAGSNLGFTVEPSGMMGGCDGNVFREKGLRVANLGTGMRAIHTVREWLDVRDLYRSARVILEVVRLNGELSAALPEQAVA